MGLLQVPGARGDRGGLGPLRRARCRRRPGWSGPAASASWICDGDRKCTCESKPPAVRILPSPEITSVPGPMTSAGSTPSAMSGLPLRPMPTIRPVPDPDVGADDAPVVQDHHVGDHRVQRALGRGGQRLVHRLADRLAAAEDRLLAAEGEVLLDLDPQVGVTQPDLVAGGRPVDRRVRLPRDPGHQAVPSTGSDAADAGHRPAALQRDDPRRTRGARLEPDRRCPPGCPAGSPARRPGRTPGRGSRRAGGCASRPGSAGRRCWRRSARRARPGRGRR